MKRYIKLFQKHRGPSSKNFTCKLPSYKHGTGSMIPTPSTIFKTKLKKVLKWDVPSPNREKTRRKHQLLILFARFILTFFVQLKSKGSLHEKSPFPARHNVKLWGLCSCFTVQQSQLWLKYIMTALHGVPAHIYSVSARVCRCLPPPISREKLTWRRISALFSRLLSVSPIVPKATLCFPLMLPSNEYRSRIHERTISLRCLSIILSVLRLEVSVYNVYRTLQISFQPILLKEGGEGSRIR